jgi:hypothetical protein
MSTHRAATNRQFLLAMLLLGLLAALILGVLITPARPFAFVIVAGVVLLIAGIVAG